MVGQVVEQVGVMVSQVVQHHLTSCHLVLITTTQHSLITANIIRRLSESVEAGVLVEVGWEYSQDQLAQDQLQQGVWGDSKTTCRGLILDFTNTNNTHSVLRFLEKAELWKLPETLVIVVGRRTEVKDVLLHHSFHNTVHVLYLALHDLTLHDLTLHELTLDDLTVHSITLNDLTLHASPPTLLNSRNRQPVARASGGVWVYRKCLYCNRGEADIQLLHLWNLTSFTQIKDDLFQEQFHNFWGKNLKMSTVLYFPFMDYTLENSEQGSTVSLKDCLDARLLSLFAKTLNTSFQIHEAPERQYGMQKNGRFTGITGQLQREEADMGGSMGPLAERIPAMEFLWVIEADPLAIVSLKPTISPQLLSLSKPFTGELWLTLLLSMVLWSGILWLLQKVWCWVTGTHTVNFITILLYGWGALLANLPSDPSVNKAEKVLVGAWLMFCLVISTGYSSSLVAHLSVQEKTKPPETYEDLVTLNNWKWGIESWVLNGAVLLYFLEHTDPQIQKLYKGMERVTVTKGLEKVKAGGYSFMSIKHGTKMTIDSLYSDIYGQTPYYLGHGVIQILAGFGWGFRKGAPFYNRFMQLMVRLQDAGIVSRLMKEVFEQRVRENKAAAALNQQAITSTTPYEEESRVVLGMNHLQGAFYMLLLGTGVAFLTLLGENLAHWCSSPHTKVNKRITFQFDRTSPMQRRPSTKRLTTTERTQAVMLYLGGMSARDIALKYQIGVSTVYKCINKWIDEARVTERCRKKPSQYPKKKLTSSTTTAQQRNVTPVSHLSHKLHLRYNPKTIDCYWQHVSQQIMTEYYLLFCRRNIPGKMSISDIMTPGYGYGYH
ncbi:glutamate receptor ionotropic, kainate 2-like [Cherax quadricarinatus]|uniref:glutamate receptor ionotropic, kainate 2-like n=1 Tax=Cherax quadricarinatus TaxID=27406 RepID=UPI00387E29CD